MTRTLNASEQASLVDIRTFKKAGLIMNKYRKERIISNVKFGIFSPIITVLLIWLAICIYRTHFDINILPVELFLVLLTSVGLFSWWASWGELFDDVFKYKNTVNELHDIMYENDTKNNL